VPIYIILPLISGMFVLFLGLFVLGKNRRSKVNQIFFLFTFSVAIWLFASFIMFLSKTDEQTIFWDRIVYLGVVFIPTTFYHFSLLFTKIKNQKRLLYLGYFLSFLFLILSRTDYFISDLYKYSWGVHTQARIFHHLFLVFFASYIFLSFSNTRRYYQWAKGVERRQAAYILLVLLIIVLSSFAFLPAYRIDIPPFFSYFLPVISVSILTFAVIKYHLFEIRVILTELLVGVMGIILLVLPFLMPTTTLRVLTTAIFLLFLIFGYYLIKATHEEAKRREKAELVAVQERALRKSAEKLAKEFERLDRAKSQFILATQHHLRTPLSIIKGYVSMILEGSYGKVEEKTKKAVSGIQEAIDRLIKLVNEFLDISQLQVGREILKKEEIQIEQLIKEIIEELRPMARERGIYLKFESPRELPKIKLDRGKIKTAIFSIVDNGIKYTEKGGVEIKLEGNERIKIIVKDTGIGFSSEEFKNLFTGFFERGKEAEKIYTTGRGIGLYIAKNIIEAHQGKIWAESKGKDRGSTFYVELPIK